MSEKKLMIVLNGPSAVGKSALMEHLATRDSRLFRKLRSVTTRERRSREDDSPYSSGPEYRFVSRKEFDGLIAAERIVQTGEFRGERYGLELWYTKLQLGSKHGVIALTKSGVDLLATIPDLAPRVRVVAVCADLSVIRDNMRHHGHGADEIENEMPVVTAHIGPFRVHAMVTNLGRPDSVWRMAESLKHQLEIKDED